MRSIPAVSRLGSCDAVFVSTHEGEAALSCAARIDAETARGRRTLVVTLFRAPEEEVDPGGLSLGLADAPHRDPDYVPLAEAVFGRSAAEDECLADATHLLDEVFRRTGARQIYLPLGVGGHVDHRIAHEAGLKALPPHPGRDIFFYEERPDALVPGAVRMRLGEMGARLPPGAGRVAREGGLARFLVRYNAVPHRRERWRGLGERVALTRLAAKAWWEARAWQPQKAFGVRVQPVVQEAQDLDAVLESVRRFDERRGVRPRAVQRLMSLSAAYARRLGGRVWVERYWLLLPAREEADRGAWPVLPPGAVRPAPSPDR
ncbi:MAG TPA: hypothetical protein VFM88_09440 [Vicinamibacteria bacterium]|nr:hypothetical protein [Vicinamibacteria bacterium]